MENNNKLLKKIPIKVPVPNIETFCKTIKREIIPSRPPLVELLIDETLMKNLMEQKAGVKWIHAVSGDRDSERGNIKSKINFWYHFGYDYIRLSGGLDFSRKSRVTNDASSFSKEKRT